MGNRNGGRHSLEPTRRNQARTRSATHAMSSAVAAGSRRGLHDVAEHQPDDHVDDGVEPVRRRGRSGSSRSARATTILAPTSSDSACVVRSGSSSVSAPWVAETTACRRALFWAYFRTRRAESRIAWIRSSGFSSNERTTPARNRSSSREHHRLGQVVLGADLVVDRLPADPDLVGEPRHRDPGPALARDDPDGRVAQPVADSSDHGRGLARRLGRVGAHTSEDRHRRSAHRSVERESQHRAGLDRGVARAPRSASRRRARRGR